jgi:hypothetical protein
MKTLAPRESESACGTCKGCGGGAKEKVLVEIAAPSAGRGERMVNQRR